MMQDICIYNIHLHMQCHSHILVLPFHVAKMYVFVKWMHSCKTHEYEHGHGNGFTLSWHTSDPIYYYYSE